MMKIFLNALLVYGKTMNNLSNVLTKRTFCCKIFKEIDKEGLFKITMKRIGGI